MSRPFEAYGQKRPLLDADDDPKMESPDPKKSKSSTNPDPKNVDTLLADISPRAARALRKALQKEKLDNHDYYDLQVAVKEAAFSKKNLDSLIQACRKFLNEDDVEHILEDPVLVEIINCLQEGKDPCEAIFRGLQKAPDPLQPPAPAYLTLPQGKLVLFDPRPLFLRREIGVDSIRLLHRSIRNPGSLGSEDVRTLRTEIFNRVSTNVNPFPVVALFASKLDGETFKRIINENTFNRLKQSAGYFNVTPQELRQCLQGLLVPPNLVLPAVPETEINPILGKDRIKDNPTEYTVEEIPGVTIEPYTNRPQIQPRTKRWMESVVYVMVKKGKPYEPFLAKMTTIFGEAQMKKVRDTARMRRTIENAKTKPK